MVALFLCVKGRVRGRTVTELRNKPLTSGDQEWYLLVCEVEGFGK